MAEQRDSATGKGALADTLYDEPAYYRMLFDGRRHDLSFYAELADERGGPVLEYGIGTGRVAIPLARAGYAMVGIDRSESMLSSLAEQVRAQPAEVRERLEWQCADARTARLGRRFPLVLCPFNGIAHHHSLDELGAFLARVREHLGDGGRFAFDVLVPDPGLLRGESCSIPWFRDPRTGEAARSDETAAYDAHAQLMTITSTVRPMEREAEPEVLTLRLRMLFPQETLLLLRHHGFEVLRRVELGDAIGYVCRLAPA